MTCLLQKNKKNYLSQSFIPIIFFSVKFNYTLWLSYNYGAWEAANYFLWKILKFLAEIQHSINAFHTLCHHLLKAKPLMIVIDYLSAT